MMKPFLVIISSIVLLTGCQTNNITTHSVNNATSHKRINTTECKDADDWYLDGYRVGKSFRDQKQAMFEQRMAYCHFTLKTLPASYKTNWESGFKIGHKG